MGYIVGKKEVETKIRRGSGNVFTDLGFPAPEIHLLKARLVSRVQEIVSERKLTPIDASRIMGVKQSDGSRMLKGHFRDVPVENIMRILTKLDCEVDIVVKPRGHKRAFAAIHLTPADRCQSR
jgi:predicted XRE-type DNA-binding protein